MIRHIASNAITFLIVALFLLAGVIAWGGNTYRAEGPLETAICLQVPSGSNFRDVRDDLTAEGAISQPWLFMAGADYSDKTNQLKAGSFLIEDGASMAEIVDAITGSGVSTCGTEIVYRIGVTRSEVQVRELDPATNRYGEVASFNPLEEEAPAEYLEAKEGQDTRYRIAVAEGVTSWQIANSLNAIDVLDGEIAEIPAEGSLAPDSYEFRPGDEASEIIAEMEGRQETILADAWANRADGVPLENPEEALILASIVEKETGVPEERGQVASVFTNRLNEGMRLQTDPTVIYGITRGQGVLGRGLRQSELRGNTPWNTYVIDGLPPTPIANPGRASIEAALNPDSTDFIFFVADGTGGHAFATNLADHNRNVAAWRAIEAERANN
ncbi:UPF0755 protein [Cognatiyoonia sediminum]|uniref:Endolytic murein transglycosylase n=1 Tax=Cognatiyoonia sediminum TaxID=1508389 RepID=A0A1M5MLZ8_9RHOB|nr:endolytic transglycosylase MltG [Cognatiyoonia sediminum]SHG78266.1 UPF0755 protein [Cognatiyoonia sediminum]